MSEVGNLYDNGPISPICKIKENVSVLTGGDWSHFKVEYIEPLPRSSPLSVDVVALSGNVLIAANGTIAKQLTQVLRLNDKELTHLRFEPIDDVEGVLWEQSSQGRYATAFVQARVNRFTASRDPWLATTTFYVIGKDRDINLEARNPNGVAMPQARFVFWGYRYILSPLNAAPQNSTYVPAEGRSA